MQTIGDRSIQIQINADQFLFCLLVIALLIHLHQQIDSDSLKDKSDVYLLSFVYVVTCQDTGVSMSSEHILIGKGQLNLAL